MQTFGRFTIDGELGSGGMGRVYRAHDPTLRRSVAIKILHDADPGARERLLAEARAASALNHPNICTVYEVGDVDGVPFIAMALVDGRPLSAILEDAPLTADMVGRLGSQIAGALAHAHDRGIVHGDLKTQNVLVGPGGTVTLVDFGLSRTLDRASLESITETQPLASEVAGTLPYMAPETLRGAPLRPTTDIWALGILLHEMIAGRRPFDGATAFELASAILDQRPEAPPESAPPALAVIISRCLDKDPARRYSTGREVAAAIEALSASRPTAADRRGSGRWTVGAIAVGLAAVVAVAATVVYFWPRRDVGPRQETAPQIRSLIVLPFDNRSPDAGEDYFADGMTDALITDLSRLPSLRVISRTSSSRYKNSGKTTQDIGRELGVDAIVDGAVLRAAADVRISVRLVDAADDRILWAQDYTRRVEDVLSLQADVARAIAAEIRASFLPADQARFASAGVVRPDAVEEYLKGRHQWNRRSPASLLQAAAHFKQALALEPDYAQALAGLAQVFVVLPAFPISAMAPADALPQARAAAGRAIALDDRLAEAHAALGYERLFSGDRSAALARFQQAISLNPGYATAHFWHAAALAADGRFDEALAEARRAESLDPVSPIIVSGTAWMHHLARQFDREVEKAREALTLDPTFLIAHYRLGEGLLGLGRTTEATAAFEKARELSDNTPDLVAAAAYGYARAGRPRDARAALASLLSLREAKTRYVSSYGIALVLAGLDQPDEALVWLTRARAEHAWGVAFLAVDPAFDSLRADPRFQALAAK